jgi:hypothetical protein
MKVFLKSRRQNAEGMLSKLIEMQEKVREFDYKWQDEDENKSKPIQMGMYWWWSWWRGY